MNAYRIDIWRSVKHDGKFSHTDSRTIIIHAKNEDEAKSKITLRKEQSWSSTQTNGLQIDVSSEYIYSCEKIGTVTIQPFYVYSNDRPPISVKQYKEHYKKVRSNGK